jgi:hypothetical protein
MKYKYECAFCDKEGEYDTEKAVKILARLETQQMGKDVYYYAFYCEKCGKKNERKPPEDGK